MLFLLRGEKQKPEFFFCFFFIAERWPLDLSRLYEPFGVGGIFQIDDVSSWLGFGSVLCRTAGHRWWFNVGCWSTFALVIKPIWLFGWMWRPGPEEQWTHHNLRSRMQLVQLPPHQWLVAPVWCRLAAGYLNSWPAALRTDVIRVKSQKILHVWNENDVLLRKRQIHPTTLQPLEKSHTKLDTMKKEEDRTIRDANITLPMKNTFKKNVFQEIIRGRKKKLYIKKNI